MRNHIDKVAKYIAFILISSLPFSIEILTDSEKEQLLATSLAKTEKDSGIKRKVSDDTE